MKAKRLICTVLTLVLLVGVMPMTASAEEVKNYDNYTEYIFTMNDGSGYTMAVYNDGTCYVRDAYPGNSGECWFDQSWDKRHGDVVATKYVIEAGITHVIGVPISTVSVTLADSVIMFDTDGGRRDFREIIWGNNVQTIRYGGFKNCTSLTSIAIPDTVTDMGGGLFVNCTSLSSVSLPSHLTIIPQHTFENCTSLSSISLPDNVEVIEDYAFYNTALSSITLPEGFLSINHHAFENTNISSISFPESLIGIGINAFAGTPLTEVVIPESVTYIGDGAFPAGEQFTIYGYRNTHAQWFAEGNGNTFIPLDDCGIKVSIKDENIIHRNVNAGTVMNSDGSSPDWSFVTQRSFDSKITITPDNDCFDDVHLLLKLPQGFSFAMDDIITENYLNIGSLSEETTVELPTIYPVYLSDLNQTSAYKMTVEITASDSVGEQVQGTQSVSFFEPGEVTNHASNAGSYLNGASYTFSLDSAIGSGSAYSNGTAELAVLLSAAAYESEAIGQFLSQLGFSEIKTVGGKYGYTLAHKRLLIDDEIKELVYVICRGENEHGEWWGDVNFGNGEEHQNYCAAAKNVGNALYDYCEDYDIFLREPDDRYLMITGYSHGAGVANILANTVNNGWLSEVFSKNNTSAYTFATPNVTTDANTGNNGNVFNFVHYQDLYLNTPSMQHYNRYGTTRIFGFYNDAGFGHYTTMYENYGLDATANSSYTRIWNYTELELLSARLMTQNPRTNVSYFAMASHMFLALRLGESTGGNLDNLLRLSEAGDAHSISVYYRAVTTNATTTSKDAVMQRLETIEEDYENSIMPFYEKIWTIANMCPVNVYVEDLSGNTVAYIENGESVSTSPYVCVWTVEDHKYTSISEEHLDEFMIRIEAYDYGVMTHGILIAEDEVGSGTLSARKDIPLAPGKTYYVSPDSYIDSADNYVTYIDESTFDTALAQEQIHFSDVAETDWFYKSVYAAAPAGFIAGNPDGTFNPNGTLSWAQAIAFAVRLNQYNCGEAVKVPDGYVQTNWYDFYMEYALERGLIESVPASPNGPISRGDAAKVFARVLGDAEMVNSVPDNYFTDVPTSGEAHDAVYALAQAGITVGMGGTNFGFDSTFRRSEAAAIVARMAGLVNPAKFNA